MYQNIMSKWDGKDDLLLKSILYDIDYNYLLTSTDLNMLGPLEQAAAFTRIEVLNKEKVPSVVEINGKWYDVPTRLNGYSVGQAIQARRVLESAKMYDVAIAKIVAIYLVPSDQFTMEKAEELEKEILKAPITEVLAVGYFLCGSVEQMWQHTFERMESIKMPGSEEDDFAAKMAGVHNLEPLADLSLLDKFAQAYHMDPDVVYNKSFGTVMNMLYLLKVREAFMKRFDSIRKTLNPL